MSPRRTRPAVAGVAWFLVGRGHDAPSGDDLNAVATRLSPAPTNATRTIQAGRPPVRSNSFRTARTWLSVSMNVSRACPKMSRLIPSHEAYVISRCNGSYALEPLKARRWKRRSSGLQAVSG